MSVSSRIEAILFVASRPVSTREIAAALAVSTQEIAGDIEALREKYNHDESGIHILSEGDRLQMAANPACEDTVRGFVKEEAAGELTKAQLETLTVIAYRSPITRPELEQIRGVNCAVILRNLLLRGLIEEQESHDALFPAYVLSFDALAHLGIASAEELPEYQSLRAHEYIDAALEQQE